MATDPHDPRPQAEISTVGGVRRTEPRGAYVDQALTVRNLAGQATTVGPTPAHELGNTKVYDPAGTVKTGFPSQSPLPQAPNSWRVGRDPYAHNGMVGQTFFKNSGQ